MKKANPIRKIYDSRVFWAIISLLASFAIWLYITSLETEEYKQTFRGVRVELLGEENLRNSRNLVVTDLDTNTVTVEITGPRRVVAAMDKDDLVAQIDVSKLTQSAYTSQTYEIYFPDGVDSKNLNVNRMTPATVNFMASKQSSKTVQVRGSFDGSLAEGYTAETPVFEPASIVVSGPEAYIKDVAYAWVSFGTDNVDKTYSVDTGYTLLDSEGEPCATAGLSFSTDTVNATLPLLQVKDVPLNVDIIEGAGATAANTKISIEPKSISLAGDSSILGGMNKITLATIDLTDFNNSFKETYPITFDNELKNLTGLSEAKVTVEIVGLEMQNFFVNNLSVQNVTEGYTAEIISESITVTLRGTAEQLAHIKRENLRAVADLEDYRDSEGTFMPIVKIYVDGFTNVGAIGEYKITVHITKD